MVRRILIGGSKTVSVVVMNWRGTKLVPWEAGRAGQGGVGYVILPSFQVLPTFLGICATRNAMVSSCLFVSSFACLLACFFVCFLSLVPTSD